MDSSLTIVLPVFNDWPSFLALLKDSGFKDEVQQG